MDLDAALRRAVADLISTGIQCEASLKKVRATVRDALRQAFSGYKDEHKKAVADLGPAFKKVHKAAQAILDNGGSGEMLEEAAEWRDGFDHGFGPYGLSSEAQENFDEAIDFGEKEADRALEVIETIIGQSKDLLKQLK